MFPLVGITGIVGAEVFSDDPGVGAEVFSDDPGVGAEVFSDDPGVGAEVFSDDPGVGAEVFSDDPGVGAEVFSDDPGVGDGVGLRVGAEVLRGLGEGGFLVGLGVGFGVGSSLWHFLLPFPRLFGFLGVVHVPLVWPIAHVLNASWLSQCF